MITADAGEFRERRMDSLHHLLPKDRTTIPWIENAPFALRWMSAGLFRAVMTEHRGGQSV